MRDTALILVALAGAMLAVILSAQAQADDPPAQTDYDRVVRDRARKIVDTLSLDDAAQADRVTNIIAQLYKDLSAIHDARDQALKRADTDEEKSAIQEQIQQQIHTLHAAYLQHLAEHLTDQQIEQVKDGMTYNVANITYQAYLDMLPNLTDEQKAQIRAMLIEAREVAMDGGSSKDKHAVFGKYKGRINNYLSAQGYDLKQATQDWAERRKAQQQDSAGE